MSDLQDFINHLKTEKDKIPVQHESKSRGSCTYNWYIHYIKLAEDFVPSVAQPFGCLECGKEFLTAFTEPFCSNECAEKNVTETAQSPDTKGEKN